MERSSPLSGRVFDRSIGLDGFSDCYQGINKRTPIEVMVKP